jgi:hypothetical protein
VRVWIVFGAVDWGVENVVGVFSTEEKANEVYERLDATLTEYQRGRPEYGFDVRSYELDVEEDGW